MEQQSRAGFGPLLKRYRLAQGLTQEELADRAGISTRAVNYLENGARSPFPGTVRRLAVALQLAPQELSALTAFLEAMPGNRRDISLPGRGSPSALIGRERELSLVEQHLVGNGPPVLLPAGEPGIGKSRILRAAADWAVSHDMCVLTGGCRRRGSQEPYTPIIEALKGHIQRQAPADLPSLLLGCGRLVRLLPELAAGPIEPLPDWKLSPEQERRLIADAVIRYLTNTAEPAGALLVLDDIQWAGPDALELLSSLAHAATRIPTRLRIIAAYRTTELDDNPALTTTLSDLAQAGLVTYCALGSLSREESRSLLDQLIETADGADAALRAEVVERWADAVQYLEESLTIGERIRNPRPILLAQLLLAEYDLRMGRPNEACTRLVAATSRPDLGKDQAMLALPHLAWVWIELGDVAYGRNLAEEAYTYACDKHLFLLRIDALWQLARATLRLGDLQAAWRVLDEGLGMARRMNYPLALARFLQLHEHIGVREYGSEAARERPATAEEMFRRLGAAPEPL